MKRTFILFSLFFFLQLYGKAQELFVSATISWKTPEEVKTFNGNRISVLSFEGSSYNSPESYLPIYNKKVQLSNSAIINPSSVQLTNEVYQPLNDKELALVSSNEVNSIIQLSTRLIYERKKTYAIISFIPIRKNVGTGKLEKLVSFQLVLKQKGSNAKSFKNQISYAPNSVLSSGTWYKIGITKNAVYKLSHDFLQGLGINMQTLNPQNIRIYGNGGMLSYKNSDFHYDDLVENAVQVVGESDGVFNTNDYVLFYGKDPHSWKYSASDQRFHHKLHYYSDTTYYFLTVDLGPGKRVESLPSAEDVATHTVNSFDDYQYHERELENIMDLKSGREWYGESFDETNKSFNFSFPNLDLTSPVYLKAAVVARSKPASSFSINCQSGSLKLTPAEVNVGYYLDTYAMISEGFTVFTPTSNNLNVNVTFNKNPAYTSAKGWLDYLQLNVRRNLTLSGNQMSFRDILSVGQGNISEFIVGNTNSSIVVWDITNPVNTKLQQTLLSGTSLLFRAHTDTLREFIAFDPAAVNEVPTYIGNVDNQNLHGLGFFDFLIVSPSEFVSEAQRLGNFHQTKDGLSFVVVTPQQIYNEFSSGTRDITAIKHFVKMFYDRAPSEKEMPKYLLLFGDGSYNNRTGSAGGNFIPTYQSLNSTAPIYSYVSDDYYGLLDDQEGEGLNEAVDIGIGRLPVKSLEEAKLAVDKIQRYMEKAPLQSSDNTINFPGDWKNTICFIGDDEDNNIHLNNADALALYVNNNYHQYNIDKIYFDAYMQESAPGGKRYPGATESLNQRVERGALIMNYVGHGGELGWAHERVLKIADIKSWKNEERTPLFVTATCEFSPFDQSDVVSAGEEVFLNPNGGGIALLTTTRVVYSSPNQTLNSAFYKHVFEEVNGKMPRLGDISRAVKDDPNVINNSHPNHRNFTLLGDPALQLNYPIQKVITTAINSQPVGADTLKALSKITISGFVADKQNNNKLSDFNGVVYPTVYDKAITVNTLGNDQDSPLTSFKLQKNILYKGKAKVTNGEFSFAFIVPKDIAYQYGKGRLSYYADNGVTDASGYNEDFVIGGFNASAPGDALGPDVKLYLNDTKFVSGGTTNEAPVLLAFLKDDNGINATGNGIGHDITATIDGKTEDVILLNDFYQADMDSYQSGVVRYPLSNLSEGKHTLTFKVWDVYNNPTQTSIDFVVAKSTKLAIDHVLNYPNPFTTNTTFYFEHNQPYTPLQVQIQVFTISGKLVKTIDSEIQSEGFRSEGIAWNGLDDFNDKIARGVYIYRMKVTAPNGSYADKFEKLVILN